MSFISLTTFSSSVINAGQVRCVAVRGGVNVEHQWSIFSGARRLRFAHGSSSSFGIRFLDHLLSTPEKHSLETWSTWLDDSTMLVFVDVSMEFERRVVGEGWFSLQT